MKNQECKVNRLKENRSLLFFKCKIYNDDYGIRGSSISNEGE